jgi:glyoxylase-like metal-dependent hydrolase (beta-lactamase superfamily II)
MREVADDVWILPRLPRHGLNVYVVGDVIVDAGTRLDAPLLVRALRGRTYSGHAITHCHPDHIGATPAIAKAFGVDVWAGALDAESIANGRTIRDNFPRLPFGSALDATVGGGSHVVERSLVEGDAVGGFTVIDCPGHTRGHIALWRESDRVLIAGDVLLGMSPLTTRAGPHAHLDYAMVDLAENRRSLAKLAALEPDIVCFGHGPPLIGAAGPVAALAASVSAPILG